MTQTGNHTYEADFFEYISHGAKVSAEIVVAEMDKLVGPFLSSVIDVGCGEGVWTAQFETLPQVTHVIGVDGDYVDENRLKFSPTQFRPFDLREPFDLNEKFGLAVCLEVGEHLAPDSGPALVQSLTKHADLVLFSAAIPGQGGEHHSNERPLEYWRKLFKSHGYVPSDCLRPVIAKNSDVEPWYRYNSLLYVAESRLDEMPASVVDAVIPAQDHLPSHASILWKIRCGLLGLLPRPAIEVLASMKHAAVRRRYGKFAKKRANG